MATIVWVVGSNYV